MKTLILIMIILGSSLMVYNIIRYFLFIKNDHDLDKESSNRVTVIIPLLLLIFFLIGYISIGFSGIADIMVASILLGGSIFVFLLIMVMVSIVAHVKDTEQMLAHRFEELKEQIDQYTKESLCSFRVNLTNDEIEERSGNYLYETDYHADSYTELMQTREKYVIDSNYSIKDKGVFSKEGLIKRYLDGQSNVSEILFVKRSDGVPSFVKFDVTMTKKPVTGDIVAFIVETPYNEEVIKKTLLEKVLMDQYDRIAYVINGNYKVLISNAGKKEGMLLQNDDEDTYESIYYNYILPNISKEYLSKDGQPNKLRLSVIEKELKEKGIYDVNALFTIDGKQCYKHFIFYLINPDVNYFLMLLTDSTAMHNEQEERNKELSSALEEAVKANDARIHFFSNLSHDLRTPLNGILGYSDLAKKENDPIKIKDYVEKIDESSKILLKFIDNLFTMSIIESGKLEIKSEEINLDNLLQEISDKYQTQCQELNTTINLDTSKVINHNVMIDKKIISQIISQLVENSLNFIKEDNINISIEQENKHYKFIIENKGLDISEEQLKHIFDMNAWTKSNVEEATSIYGAGLAMMVIKAYVDEMGGNIKIESNNGIIKAIIEFDLEIVDNKNEEQVINTQRNLKLLVVDDNEINREIAQLMLTSVGYQVNLAENGKEAVDILLNKEVGSYDVVLMDVQMPVMNGYEATKAIRESGNEELAKIPVIAMTANAYQEDYNNAINAGMDGYVTKPIDIEMINKTIDEVLKKKRG